MLPLTVSASEHYTNGVMPPVFPSAVAFLAPCYVCAVHPCQCVWSYGSSILIEIVFHNMNTTLFVHSYFDGHLDCFPLLLLLNILKYVSSYTCARLYLDIYQGEKLLSFF